MYTCMVRIQHISPHGDPYTRVHFIQVVHTVDAAVRLTGAVPLTGTVHQLHRVKGCTAEIVYSPAPPLAQDPSGIILCNLPGGLYLRVPYACTFERLVRRIIPAALQRLGVHRHDLVGTLARMDGTRAAPADVWGACVRQLQWCKLRVPIVCAWPPGVLRAVVALQRRQKKSKLLPQGVEPWTICS
jgi:hypothetical protein